jgi:hypothetical protein
MGAWTAPSGPGLTASAADSSVPGSNWELGATSNGYMNGRRSSGAETDAAAGWEDGACGAPGSSWPAAGGHREAISWDPADVSGSASTGGKVDGSWGTASSHQGGDVRRGDSEGGASHRAAQQSFAASGAGV